MASNWQINFRSVAKAFITLIFIYAVLQVSAVELYLYYFFNFGPVTTAKWWAIQGSYYLAPIISIAIVAVTFRGKGRTPLLGCCSNCGYDLRATPNKCPECGTAPDGERKGQA